MNCAQMVTPFLPTIDEVECLHNASVIHRDIKLSNLLLNNKAENQTWIHGNIPCVNRSEEIRCGAFVGKHMLTLRVPHLQLKNALQNASCPTNSFDSGNGGAT